MQPSVSVTLEPGSERGVPWGRDLYTFVTSAAGHMMRTLQKPRKNRPSKRQVNHRRFLHNMIQRKFADIEAANHRLASALYFKDEKKHVPALQSQKPETSEQVGSPSQSGHLQHLDKCSISKSQTHDSKGSYQTEVSTKKQPDTGHLWKRHPKSQPSMCTTRKNNQSKRQKNRVGNHKLVEFTFINSPEDIDCYHRAELVHTEYFEDDNSLWPHNNLAEHPQTALQDSDFIQNVDISPSFSPELSPLSLDSCDFSIQMFTDISTCTHSQRSIADIAETQWTDIMDLFSAGNNDLGGCMDVESHFESICACQGDAGQEVGADEIAFSDQSDSFAESICNSRSKVEDLHCDRSEYKYQYTYRCQEDQGVTTNHTAETQFNNFKPSHDSNSSPNQLLKSINYHYNVSDLQAYQCSQQESHCMLLNCENNTHFTPFEGIAQSFSAPLHNPEHRPIPTPPHEDDWLFTDILKDRKLPDC